MMNERWNDYRDGETIRAVAPQRPSSTVWESSRKVHLTKDLRVWSQRGVAMNSGLIKRERVCVCERESIMEMCETFFVEVETRMVAAVSILSAQLIQWGSALFGDTQSSPTSGH